jgi:adenosylmethionine-8-amino-7-oxononanoate aminotransferase
VRRSHQIRFNSLDRLILGRLLEERLRGPNSLAKPFTFDIRGGGGFWAVEFISDPEAALIDLKGNRLAMLIQAQSLKNGLIVMGMTGGADLEGVKGEHVIFAPAYNVTKEEIEAIVDAFVLSVEEVLREQK